MITVEIPGASLRLLPERAAWWPAHDLLLVADAHIGKAATFRRLGVPVPDGTTAGTLERLSAALARTGARRVVFLGDLLHSVHAHSAATMSAFDAWRETHAELELTLVRGNHDARAGAAPRLWRVDEVDEPLCLGALALLHHPRPVPGAYALGGHLHPAVMLGARTHERLRAPCFHFADALGVLPAFGEFTGTSLVRPRPGERVYVVAGDEVRPLHCEP